MVWWRSESFRPILQIVARKLHHTDEFINISKPSVHAHLLARDALQRCGEHRTIEKKACFENMTVCKKASSGDAVLHERPCHELYCWTMEHTKLGENWRDCPERQQTSNASCFPKVCHSLRKCRAATELDTTTRNNLELRAFAQSWVLERWECSSRKGTLMQFNVWEWLEIPIYCRALKSCPQ